MKKLTAKIREEKGKATNTLRNTGRIPAVVYGHKIKNLSLDLDYKEFEKAYKEAGTSSLIELHVEGDKEKRLVLVHDLQRDPMSDNYIHVDFFETSAKEEIEVEVPLIFEGISLAVKDLGGTLVKIISELEVKALPQNIPHEIKVSIESLKTFDDRILVKDLNLPKDVKVTAKLDETIAMVSAPTNVEEELAKEVEENVEDVEKIEKEKKSEDVVEEPKE